MENSSIEARQFCTLLKLLPKQLRRVMKLTSLIVIVACLHANAHSYSQTLSFTGKDVPLQAVFSSIEKQTGLSFFFNYSLIKKAKSVTLNVQNVSLEELLKLVLKDQMLDYYRQGKTIFIVPKQAGTYSEIVEASGPRTVNIKGRVTNQQGELLVSATIMVKNGKKSTLTDEKGGFELKNVLVGSFLEISFLGYQNREVEVKDEGPITVQLVLANTQLDEAHVIAYGETSERLSTANISMVKGDDIDKQPVNNPLLALEGRVPGLYITQTSGMPGGGVTVRIQGQNSIANGNDPLYIIDGVPYSSQLLPTGLGTQLGNSGASTARVNGNPLSYINPSDIENVEVLKDADATAIYGSRAANGAILITTKRGKVGKAKVDLNLQNGWGRVSRKLSLLNTQQYLAMRNEALNNDGTAPGQFDLDINGFWDTTRYTDWQRVLLGSTAHYTNVSGSISGGNQYAQYFIGGTYRRETTVFPNNYSDVKGSVHFSLNTVSTNQRLKGQLTGSYMVDNNRLPATDPTIQALTLAPDAPALYNPDGTLNWKIFYIGNAGFETWNNPFAAIYYNPYQNKTYNLVGNGVVTYQIMPGFEIKTNLGYTNLRTDEISVNKFLSAQPSVQAAAGPNARGAAYGYNTITSWIVEPQALFKKTVGYGTIESLVGVTFSENDAQGLQISAAGFNSDALLQDLRSAASVIVSATTTTQYKYNALFGRFKYSWKDKYIADLVARRDGSSRFGSANRFHNFASAGIAWIFSQEKIIKDVFPVLSFGKIRGSYGATGNDQIGDYKYMNLYTSQSEPVPYQGSTGLVVNSLPNPNLQWEETRKFQAGIELGFLKNRILLTANFVRNRSSNQLVLANLPLITGFTAVTENLPAVVQNTAGEFSLNISIIKTKDFNWDCNSNFTIPKNRLISYNSSTQSALVVVGQPVNFFMVYHSLGVDPTSGIYSFSDSHGTATSTPSSSTDRTRFVSPAFPTFFGGVQNTFRYKNIQLDFLFQFVKHIASNYLFGAQWPGAFATNQPTYVLNRWRKPGDITPVQRFSGDFNTAYFPWISETSSDAGFSVASFIRLKNLSLSYQVPEKMLKKLQFQTLRIYFRGQNLLTMTKYKGLDPETGSNVLPPLRVLTFGLQMGL